jgi:hypothetical protein
MLKNWIGKCLKNYFLLRYKAIRCAYQLVETPKDNFVQFSSTVLKRDF